MPASYLACEGPHDAALLGCLLKSAGFTLLKSRTLVTPGPFQRMFAGAIPDALFGRDPMPNVWRKNDHWIAIHPAGGDSALPKALAYASTQTTGPLDAIGAIVDADQSIPVARISKLQSDISSIKPAPGFAFTGGPGVVNKTGIPRTGVYVMPDNISPGSVESVLGVCAQTSYADLHQHAGAYLAAIDRSILTPDEQKQLSRGSNPVKAHLAVIGSVLRPGYAIQNTIRDDRWIDATTIGIPLVGQLRNFLRDLLNEPTI